MKDLLLPNITQNYTKIVYDENSVEYGAPHEFRVLKAKPVQNDPANVLTTVHFQRGPIKECGVNGCANEDLIAMVICRLQGFQNTAFECKENAAAIECLNEALEHLRERTNRRVAAGTEGTSKL